MFVLPRAYALVREHGPVVDIAKVRRPMNLHFNIVDRLFSKVAPKTLRTFIIKLQVLATFAGFELDAGGLHL